jgi:hypothetical protein
MCNVIPNRRMAFTLLLSVLVSACGIKWATNKVLSNPDAIAKVGAVYDVLTPRDTTERLVFIQGDSIVMETSDTVRVKDTLTMDKTDTHTIYITKQRIVRKTDTIITRLPPDNRLINRLNDTVAIYKALAANLRGSESNYKAQVKTAEKRLIWMAAGVLLLGTVIGLLIKFKVKL